MMKFQIVNAQRALVDSGYVLSFEVKFDGILVRNLSILRPDEDLRKGVLKQKKFKGSPIEPVLFEPSLRDAIGQQAVEILNAATGWNLEFAVHYKAGRRPKPEPKPTDAPDAGVRRIVGADVEDALTLAGMGA
jgi:hypothetical protein